MTSANRRHSFLSSRTRLRPAAVATLGTSDVAVEIAGATVRVLSADGPGDRLLGGIAVAAMRIDVRNNYDYGVQISGELAGVMLLAAIGVTALPAAAAIRGWDWLLRLGTAASVLLTVWAAVSAYADKQGKDILARQATSAVYEAAQAEAAAIAETSSSADLEALAAFQRELIANETKERGGCGPNCRKAEESPKLVFPRL